MSADTVLTLGDFTFVKEEVPERIAFGGDQLLSVFQLQGGARVVDSMGPSERPLEWSGRFRGASAVNRARALNEMRKSGKPIELAWSELRYTVVIASFTADFERFYEIPYTIRCEVVEDLAQPAELDAEASPEDALGDDMALALSLGSQIGDAGILGLLSGLQGVLGGVTDLLNAGESVLGGLTGALGGVQAGVSGLIGTAQGIIGGVTTLGGVITGGGATGNPASLSLQTGTAEQLGLLYDLSGVLGRMGANLGAIGASGDVITVAGGTMQHLASLAFDDPTQWTAIASANDLDDPLIDGVTDIRIPTKGDRSGGVLSRA